MATTTSRIFANDTDMMFWQERNCMSCEKAVWYNAKLGRLPRYKCALQRDMEAQAAGQLAINERSYKACHDVAECPLIKPKGEAINPVDAPRVIDAHDFAKGKPMERPEEAPRDERPVEVKPVEEFALPTEADLKAAEQRVLNTIWEREIAPRMAGNIQQPLTSEQLDQAAHLTAYSMLATFTWEENMAMGFVPFVIAQMAWNYAEQAMRQCAEARLSEFRDLGRKVKALRQEYLDALRVSFDITQLRGIETNTGQFVNECQRDLTILWWSMNQYAKDQEPDMPHDMMRTDALIAVLMVRFLEKHYDRVNEIIHSKMGKRERVKPYPQMLRLGQLMMDYLPNGFKLESNANIDICERIFTKNLSKIEFELNDKNRVLLNR